MHRFIDRVIERCGINMECREGGVRDGVSAIAFYEGQIQNEQMRVTLQKEINAFRERDEYKRITPEPTIIIWKDTFIVSF